MNMRNSPRVILDVYLGSPHDLAAPEWMRWATPTLEFFQPRGSFAELFTRMSTWRYNQREVCTVLALVSK
jgi:hypothetical protein